MRSRDRVQTLARAGSCAPRHPRRPMGRVAEQLSEMRDSDVHGCTNVAGTMDGPERLLQESVRRASTSLPGERGLAQSHVLRPFATNGTPCGAHPCAAGWGQGLSAIVRESPPRATLQGQTQPVTLWSRSRLRTRIFLAFSALVLAVLLATLGFTQYVVSRDAKRTLNRELLTTGEVFDGLLAERAARLRDELDPARERLRSEEPSSRRISIPRLRSGDARIGGAELSQAHRRRPVLDYR